MFLLLLLLLFFFFFLFFLFLLVFPLVQKLEEGILSSLFSFQVNEKDDLLWMSYIDEGDLHSSSQRKCNGKEVTNGCTWK